MRIKSKSIENGDNNIFWITMTDLMTALVLVFIVLFFYMYISNQAEKYKENIAKENATQTLQEAFDDQNIHAQVDKVSGIVKISDLELFELNSYKLSENGKKYLDKFAPAYLNSLAKNEYMSQNIEKIVIQGHTDSQNYIGTYSKDEQYMKNMELSLNRAYEVAKYISEAKNCEEGKNKFRDKIIVEGVSFAEPILVNGKEDYSKSRRVELKLVMKKS